MLTVWFGTGVARAQDEDHDPPTIHTISPLDGAIVGSATSTISAGFTDGAQGTGVNPGGTLFLVDSVNRTSEAQHDESELSWTPTAALAEGTHQISLYVEDLAGNGTTRNWSFIVDTLPPQLEIDPFPDPFPSQSAVIEATAYYSDAGSGLDVQSFNMAFGIGIGGVPSCNRGPEFATCISPPLKSGTHTVTASIRDLAGRFTTVATTLNLIVDTKGPEVRILSPEEGSVGNDPAIEVSGVVSDEADEVERVELNGIVIPHGNGTFAGEATLSEGQNLLTVVAFDRAGNSEASQVNVTLDSTAPTVSDLLPADGSHVIDSTPLVSATFSDGGVGLALSLTQLLVDLVDRTVEVTVSPTGIQWTPATPLEDGPHAVELHVVDEVGNVAITNWSFGVDTTAPSVTIDPFEDPFLSDSAVVQVSLSFLDGFAGSGIDASSLEIAIDGTPFENSCTVLSATATCLTPPLVTGPHSIVASIADLVGNEGTDTEPLNVIVDVAAPVVEILAPVDGSYQNVATVEISGTVTDDGPIDRVELDGQPIDLVDGAFSVQRTLEAGSNLFTVVAVDMTGRPGLDSVLVRLDGDAPVLTIDEPTDGQLSNVPTIRVTGRADDPAGIALVAVGGVPVVLTNGRFDTLMPLAEGANPILIEATDGAGNLASASRSVTYLAVPAIEITSPADLSWIAQTTVDVLGTVTEGSTVTVNGVTAVVTGGSYTAQDVPLIEGGNLITATAISTTGSAATDHVEVVRDLTAPTITLSTPVDGEVTSESAIPVAGLVNDLVVGTVNASEVEVRVNGQPAAVANRQFLLPNLELASGANLITVEAEDESGNISTATVTVNRQVPTGATIEIISGNLQTGLIEVALAQPLVARVLDAVGAPVAGVPVVFRVDGGDGSLGNGQRSQVVPTDGAGLASATFELGEYAGAASQRVRAAAVGYGEVVFRATATPGPAVQIVADAGSQQLGTAGGSVPRPFVAAVTDAGSNRLEGVPVRFTVVKGNGHFGSSATEVVVPTDSDGRAITSFVLGTDDGIANNVVVAKIDGLPEGPSAAFVASGWAAGDPAATTIVGQVLDNQNEPVPDVTMRVKNDPLMRTAVADENGFFRMTSAPVGTVYLIADGSTATRPGAWADLEYVVTTVPGRENDLGRPVYLLPIDIGNGVYISETQGGTVELENYPGLALEIAAGSVTFPGGSRTGVISVTAVHSDRVPKTPNFGQQPQLIVTIQPAGARFDPPARMTLPNLEGLPPGTVTEMYSFDHDLSQFVAIGPATVSDDATVLTSNPGVGVIKAGWHAGGDPVPTGSACNCGPCGTCVGGVCVAACPLPGASVPSWLGPDSLAMCPRPCEDNNPCTSGGDGPGYCSGGTCEGDPFQIDAIEGPCVAAANQSVTFTAIANFPELAHWSAPAGMPTSDEGSSFTTYFDGSRPAYTVSAFCPSAGNDARKSVVVAPACTQAEPTLFSLAPLFQMGPGADSTTAGMFEPYWQFAKKLESCVDSGRWCFELMEVGEQHYLWWGLNPSFFNRINVTQEDLSAVNENSCQDILNDLTPVSEACPEHLQGLTACAPYTQYISWPAIAAHEAAHESYYLTLFFPPFLTSISQGDPLITPNDCTDCYSTPPLAEIRQRLKDRHDARYSAFINAQGTQLHVNAYAIENQYLSGLRAMIQGHPSCQ